MRITLYTLIALFILPALPIDVQAQVTNVTIETFYTDDGSIDGYPAGHSTYRIYAHTTNGTDRVVGVSGLLSAPLTLNVTGNGVWNYTIGGVAGDDVSCDAYDLSPLAEYDSYLTIGYSCDNDGGAFQIYNIDDPSAQWMDEMFNTTPYGSISSAQANTAVGATWFTLPTNPVSAGGSGNKVLLAQITTNGNICGIANLQVFPNYSQPGDPYIVQNGLVIGDNTDADGDGFTSCDGDCDNNNIEVFPGATETCNSIDDNCDGIIDEGLLTTFYLDSDGDGFGNPSSSQEACSAPVNYVTDNSDCDDNNAGINPLTAEECNLADDNCDGITDEGFTYSTYYIDMDGDGYGNPNESIQACEPNGDYIANNEDCNDDNPDTNPGAVESCNQIDDNCDGSVDEGFAINTYYGDSDGDGYGNPNETIQACEPNVDFVENSDDCDDGDADVNPAATETCNGIDDDCDGISDDGLITENYYADADGDGFGNESEMITSCEQPSGYVPDFSDCNDNDSNINPTFMEICNNIDEDCDGAIDEELTLFTYFADSDGDGYGNPSVTITDCSQPQGYVSDNTDCDDDLNFVFPDAFEQCNDIDDNCNGMIDDNVVSVDYYEDNDSDGYGDTFLGNFCQAPDNSSLLDGDCDDNNADINPDAIETCNNTDDNCDGNVDEGLLLTTYYLDLDSDGYGAELLGDFCDVPPSSSTNSGDCDDTNSSINPESTELCNDLDDNCDGNSDEGLETQTYYSDADGDGFGATPLGDFCFQPANSSLLAGDCDDTNANVNPDGLESCNGIDDDCNEAIDDNVVYFDYYTDLDGDGFGSDFLGNLCTAPENSSLTDGDCDDTNNLIYPGAEEVCNVTDDDCDELIDEDLELVTYYADQDGDGFGGALLGEFCFAPDNSTITEGDCADNDAAINPIASESCNGLDDNCDGNIDEFLGSVFYADGDDDGYGDANESIVDCSQPTGYVTDSSDCDDDNAAVNPGATEIPGNDIDEDCDGEVTISIAELVSTFSIQLYPNPVSNELNVSITGNGGLFEYQILDAVGKIILNSRVNSTSGIVRLDCSNISQGVYTLKMVLGENSAQAQFVKF